MPSGTSDDFRNRSQRFFFDICLRRDGLRHGSEAIPARRGALAARRAGHTLVGDRGARFTAPARRAGSEALKAQPRAVPPSVEPVIVHSVEGRTSLRDDARETTAAEFRRRETQADAYASLAAPARSKIPTSFQGINGSACVESGMTRLKTAGSTCAGGRVAIWRIGSRKIFLSIFV